MTIQRYEIAGLEVEVRMADGMESLIPAQFEVFRVGELESWRVREWESRASGTVDGSESRYPDQNSERSAGGMKHDEARFITMKLDKNDGAGAVDGGELLDDTANDMGRVRLFRLGSGEYLVRLTDLRGSDFEMIASEDFSRCLIRGKKGERIEFRVGEWRVREGESGELESGELESGEGRASISVGGSENRDPDQSCERQTGGMKHDEARFITVKLDGNYGACGGGRAMAQSLQVDGPAMSVQQYPVGGREAVSSLIRIAFSQAVLLHGGVSIHASAVVSNGEGYMFLGASGTGKSTHSQLWIKNIPDTELLNDDNPIVRLMPDGTVRVFGSPWSGKTPCYRQASAPLHGIVRLEQAPVNEFRSVSDIDAFAMLLPSCSAIKTSALLHNALCDTLIALSEAVATGVMRCRPDGEAARVCRERVSV